MGDSVDSTDVVSAGSESDVVTINVVDTGCEDKALELVRISVTLPESCLAANSTTVDSSLERSGTLIRTRSSILAGEASEHVNKTAKPAVIETKAFIFFFFIKKSV